MDAITLLKDDHKTVEKLFKRFEKAGDGAYKEKANVADKIREELSRHAAIEEQLFYPVIRATVDDVEDLTLESLEEHHIVKWVLSELDDMDPKDERFTAKMTVLIENVRHHVEEEEDDLFPKVRDALGRKDLGALGDAMQRARRIAPTHPHPRSPDTPPGNIAVGAAAAVADRVGDGVRDAAQGAVSTAQDVIGRILGGRNGSSRNASPVKATKRTGSKAATKSRKATSSAKKAAGSTAKRAGGTAKKATTATKRAGGSAKKAATSTSKRAGSTAKKTAGTARTTARKTAATAKTTAKRSAAARR
ncbi:MAG: hemerythrin domain-containing protein [Acidimicrobiales bacterium]|nr:hemerythrin domain-containing protein [Acidimicrobiales bacterium]